MSGRSAALSGSEARATAARARATSASARMAGWVSSWALQAVLSSECENSESDFERERRTARKRRRGSTRAPLGTV